MSTTLPLLQVEIPTKTKDLRKYFLDVPVLQIFLKYVFQVPVYLFVCYSVSKHRTFVPSADPTCKSKQLHGVKVHVHFSVRVIYRYEPHSIFTFLLMVDLCVCVVLVYHMVILKGRILSLSSSSSSSVNLLSALKMGSPVLLQLRPLCLQRARLANLFWCFPDFFQRLI